jgi:hypothetical protein
VKPLERGHERLLFAVTRGHLQRILNRWPGSEVEVRCLAVAKGPAHPFCPIAGGFPLLVPQEVTQPRELRLIHRRLDLLEWRHALIRWVLPPRLIAPLCLGHARPIATAVSPQAIPLDQELPCSLQRCPNRTDQQGIELGLLFGTQVVGPP